MDRDDDTDFTLDIGSVTEDTNGIGPIPELTLGQMLSLLSDD